MIIKKKAVKNGIRFRRVKYTVGAIGVCTRYCIDKCEIEVRRVCDEIYDRFSSHDFCYIYDKK